MGSASSKNNRSRRKGDDKQDKAVKNKEKKKALDAKRDAGWKMLVEHGNAYDAVAILEECVEDDDEEAMWMLGLCKEYGIGTQQDFTRADLLYSQSIKEGSVFGKFSKEQGQRGNGVLRVSCLLYEQ